MPNWPEMSGLMPDQKKVGEEERKVREMEKAGWCGSVPTWTSDS